MTTTGIKTMDDVTREALKVSMIDWQPIETALEQLPYQVLNASGKPFKSYASALVYGPTWEPEDAWINNWPANGRGSWSGEPRMATASTYEGKGFWTIDSDAPGDYDTHIQPTHWALLEPPLEDGSKNQPATESITSAEIERLREALRDAHTALTGYACHVGALAPCIRSKDQCDAQCGKEAGDALVKVAAALGDPQ